jgi:dihydroorotate dehydrogenase electron transfer subunit
MADLGGQRGALRPSLPVALTLSAVRQESREMVSLFFARPPAEAAARGLDLDAFTPGQFFMVWLPRVDEKPYAVSYLDDERLGISVMRRGPFSGRLCDLKPGAKVGLRGPLGRGFRDVETRAASDRAALIGGGCGVAVLAPLADCLPRAKLVQGARTADLLVYRERFPGQILFTDDGSAGRRGVPTDWLREQVAAGALDVVYTCGPEVMMTAVADLCRRGGVTCQVSLERYMKCGIGVCGQCDCDGRRVCVEGPTFDLAELATMPSFGRWKRDATGRRVPVAPGDACPAAPAGGA